MIDQNPHSLEYTKALESGVFHYTCNPPSGEKLRKLNIICLGDELGCRDNREVLIIPYSVFEREGIPLSKDSESLKIASENLLRRIN